MQCDVTAAACTLLCSTQAGAPTARARLQRVVYSVGKKGDEVHVDGRDDRARTGTGSHLSALTSESARTLFLPLVSHSANVG